MSDNAEKLNTLPDFCDGIQHLGEPWANFDEYAATAVIGEGQSSIRSIDEAAVYQTLLGADGLRYVTLQLCGSKGSGHPGWEHPTPGRGIQRTVGRHRTNRSASSYCFLQGRHSIAAA